MNTFAGICIESTNSTEGWFHMLAKGSRSKVFFVEHGDEELLGQDIGMDGKYNMSEGFSEIEFEQTMLERKSKKPIKINLVTRLIQYNSDFEEHLSHDDVERHGLQIVAIFRGQILQVFVQITQKHVHALQTASESNLTSDSPHPLMTQLVLEGHSKLPILIST